MYRHLPSAPPWSFASYRMKIHNMTYYPFKLTTQVHNVIKWHQNDGKPLTFSIFQNKLNIKSNFLSYLQVVSAIPKHLLQKAGSSVNTRESFKTEETTFFLTLSLNIDLCTMKRKDYYWLYINGSTCTATGPKTWEKELKLDSIDWRSKFTLIGQTCHENKLREFNFTLIHRLTVTMKKELYPYSLEDENKCLYCREPDSVLHTFVQYHFTQDFYTKLVDWFNRKFNCTFSPKSGIVINISENSIVKFNYCLLFAKYYLYYQKMYSKR